MTWLKRALPAVALLCVIVSPSFAQITGHPIELSGGGGTMFYDTRARLQDRGALSGSVGYRLAPWLVGEAGGVYSKSYADTFPNPSASLSLLSADLRFNLRPAESRVVPFLLAGLGYGRSHMSDADPEKLARGTPSLGAGALINIMGRQRWYARVQGRDILFKERNSYELSHDLAVTLGVNYVWGGKPHDSDLDSVRDWLDKCPDTPIGATVNAEGCPTDADRDSVVNGIDKCPDTPVGCKVDKNGCPIDADGDGVCDGLDQCPNSPKGARVDTHGCPIDSDGDGVFDGIDQCENTAKGCAVDEKGCPVDADGDGVCDAFDKCPDTPAGAQVDDKGCETDASKLEGDLLDTGQLRVTGVTFQAGSANQTSGMTKVDPVGEVLSKWPELKVEIGVHSDPEGKSSPAALTQTTQARADAVRAYLLQKYPQLKADQLVAKGYGSSRPLASNASEAGRALNRRIEFTVLNKNVLVQSGGKRRLGTH